MAQIERYRKLSRDDYVQLAQSMFSNQSTNSIKTFDNGLKRIEIVYGKTLPELGLCYLEKPEELIKKLINKKYSENTILATICILSKICHLCDLPAKYHTEVKRYMLGYKKHLDEEKTKNEKTEREHKQWVQWPEIQKKVFAQINYYLSDEQIPRLEYMRFLALALFTLQTPRRLGNYLNLDVFYTPVDIEQLKEIKNKNFLCLDNDKYIFVFNNYKTSKYCGSQVYEVKDPDLIKLLKKWFESYNKGRKHLFTNRYGVEVKRVAFIEMLKVITQQLFNKAFSVDIIRHSFISDLAESNPTIAEKIQVAAELGQLYRPQMLDVYNRK